MALVIGLPVRRLMIRSILAQFRVHPYRKASAIGKHKMKVETAIGVMSVLGAREKGKEASIIKRHSAGRGSQLGSNDSLVGEVH